MDAQLCEKKKISQCNGTRIIIPGKCQSTVRGFLTVHNNNNDITTCIYTMHNKFSNSLCFASFLCSSLCSADQFQLQ